MDGLVMCDRPIRSRSAWLMTPARIIGQEDVIWKWEKKIARSEITVITQIPRDSLTAVDFRDDEDERAILTKLQREEGRGGGVLLFYAALRSAVSKRRIFARRGNS